MEATAALAELETLTPELRALVLLDGEGQVRASTLSDPEPFARAVAELLDAAAALRPGGERHVARLSVEAPGGWLFAVAGGGSTLAATAGPEAAPVLALHDLSAALVKLTGDGDAEA